jgi:ATP-dependent phosphofructokinase / diphosphate-dependent phosphofructokinase
VKRIFISTGGGDAPGLNAVIYSVVHTATRLGFEVYGIRDGFEGLLHPEKYPEGGVMMLDHAAVHGIAQLGGTILGSTNRGNPFRHTIRKLDGSTVEMDRSADVINAMNELGSDVLISIGGDGTLKIAHELSQKGLRVIGVPKTIDNDLEATDLTFGFQTATSFATECIERLHATAEAHGRIICVEVMGRYAGWIALHAGVAAMADAILIPEVPFNINTLAADLWQKLSSGRRHAIVVVAEGALESDGQVTTRNRRGGEVERLGGIGELVASQLQEILKVESRSVTLGHLLRGGAPIPFDRLLGLSFGTAAVEAAAEHENGMMVALQGWRIVRVPLAAAVLRLKRVPPDGMGVAVARELGVSLGDGKVEGIHSGFRFARLRAKVA